MTEEQQKWVDPLSTEKLIEVLKKEYDSIDEKFEKYMHLTRREQEIPHLYRWRDELR